VCGVFSCIFGETGGYQQYHSVYFGYFLKFLGISKYGDWAQPLMVSCSHPHWKLGHQVEFHGIPLLNAPDIPSMYLKK
jgi:hypothetical protein